MAGEAERLATLARERYISLTTFRRDGTPVSTPVWVVSDDGRRLLVWTDPGSWKVSRLKRDPRVRVAACDARGKLRGTPVEGRARLLSADVEELVQTLLRRKYGFAKRALDAYSRVARGVRRRPKRPAAYIEISPADDAV